MSTLSFSYTFEHDRDIVYFAHFVPYTYSHLTRFINSIPKNFPESD